MKKIWMEASPGDTQGNYRNLVSGDNITFEETETGELKIISTATGGGITLDQVKSDSDIADSLSKRHASGSDNQDLSNLVVKATGKSLVLDTEISKIHANTLDHANSLDHTQGTDQGLDGGGANAVTATQAKSAYTHSGSSHAPSNAQKNSDILKTEIEAVLTGEISSHSHAGGGGGLSQPQIMARSLGC